MAKVKITLEREPTFSSVVSIPVPGGNVGEVVFTFVGRDRDEFKVFVDNLPGKSDLDVIMEIAQGWDLVDPFGVESVRRLTTKYIGAGKAVIDTYFDQITQARSGN